MSDIFISYARSTEAQAQAAAAALRALGYDVWLDDAIPAHRAYGPVIEERLTAAKAVLVLWSADAVISEWVASEANRGREARKLVQINIDGSRLPMPFDQIQCTNLVNWRGDVDAPGWLKVLASIAELVGGATPTLPVVARRALRANVLQWTVGYIVAGFGALQGIAQLVVLFGWAGWLPRATAILLGWGVPIAIIIAWYHGTPGRQRVTSGETAMIFVCAVLAAASVGWDLARQPANVSTASGRAQAHSIRTTSVSANSIAVLPFENLSRRSEDAYLSAGFSDELRDQLNRVHGLRVVARASSVLFAGRRHETTDAATVLGATRFVEGSLRKEGERMRISVRLVDAVKGTQLWSESYDRAAHDLFAVQTEIARAAAHKILPQLSPADVPAPQWQASVHDLMLLARIEQQNATTPADQDKVVDLYQRVIQTDPQSAPAHARLAKALLLQGKDVAAAEKHAQRALSLDPNLAEGYAVLGLVLFSEYKHGSGAAFRRAIDLNPNDAEAMYAYSHYLIRLGSKRARDLDAIEYMKQARDLDPISLLYNGDLGLLIAEEGDAARTAEVTQLIAKRFPNADGRFALLRIDTVLGTLDEAVAWALEARRLEPGRTDATADLAELYVRLGMPEAARRVQPQPSLRTLFWERRYADILANMARQDPDDLDLDSLGYLAFALQALGRNADAIPVLQSMGLPEIAVDDDLRRLAAVNHLMTLISALQATGDNEQARRLALWLERSVDRRQAGLSAIAKASPGAVLGVWLGCALAVQGKHEQAMAAFEATARAPTLAWLPHLQDLGCFRSLRDDPRYAKTIRIVQARYDTLRKRLPSTLAKHGLTAARR